MAALSATVKPNIFTQGNPDIVSLQSTAGTYYKGELVAFDVTNGTIINGTSAAFAAADKFAGIVDKYKVTATGDLMLSVCINAIVHVYAADPALTDCGGMAFLDVSANSGNPADILADGTAATDDICIGRILWSDGDNCVIDTGDRSDATDAA
jgi:hypothetical protein